MISADTGVLFRVRDEQILGSNIGSELLYNFGVMVGLAKSRMSVGSILIGSTELNRPFSDSPGNQMELDVMLKGELARGIYLSGGAGMGLVSGYETPDARVFVRFSFFSEYRPPDNDRDGVLDSFDSCPCDWNYQ